MACMYGRCRRVVGVGVRCAMALVFGVCVCVGTVCRRWVCVGCVRMDNAWLSCYD